MNHSHDTPLYELLRLVKQQLETRETEDGCKQGMKFDVSIEMSIHIHSLFFIYKNITSFSFSDRRIMDLSINCTSIQELRLRVILHLNFFIVII